ncbi:hypothetical protein LUI11_18245 [Bradyrhizobium diazoefficiens]|uniref:Uncharacterized protein n=1 Tax=Bradyrhizobium diazoefficiens SEMIA 5080 TaxID=754504 RepID=A0A837CEX5_9BRAD|nr:MULTISPECIES: hypothetical protein [Bradyrhizobium]MBP1095219.1 hypothetical protein [Bradyrhizobium japonicum]APO55700.1 hypothetical protein BD122_35470 [Bradyrhizobium diazoefficiens]KGJ67810.1 hypothetical protein BJA5080_01291 [Bradyrhizobium diazoefficiens SEMIA 5080]KOY07822.1 hypothetical protein AF336_23935 [Bradyrhizobium diazoefficiens]MCD9293674.1 hypothetical protein [Bradyrhizobium diazoefficiens]
MRSLIGAVVGALCVATPALAETPAAIVEDVQGKVDGIAFMDYVAPGKIIKLGPKASVTLSYLKSCLRETISEGVVLVGAEQSTVQLGEVKRDKVPCDTNAAKLSEREANQSAATTFRTMRSDAKGAPAKLPTIYGVAPLVQAKSGSTLVIERTDGKEPTITVPLKSEAMIGGKFYDFAKAGKSLTPGGSYLAILGAKRYAFQVDASATSSPTPIVGRLLRLE